MITQVEDFFTQGCGRCGRFATADCSARKWADGLHQLRRLCQSTGLTETVKWGHPCYMQAGRNVAVITAVQSDFRLIFFKPGLMKDPQSALVRQGENTQHPDALTFTDATRVGDQKELIQSYLEEAIRYAASGFKAVKLERPLEIPAGLSQAFEAAPVLAAAFDQMTPGRQRSYVVVPSSAKNRKPASRELPGIAKKFAPAKVLWLADQSVVPA